MNKGTHAAYGGYLSPYLDRIRAMHECRVRHARDRGSALRGGARANTSEPGVQSYKLRQSITLEPARDDAARAPASRPAHARKRVSRYDEQGHREQI